MRNIIFIFLLISQVSFSQKAPKKTTKELLQGTWARSAADTLYLQKFEGDKFYFIRGNQVLCESFYQLKRKTIDTNCAGKEKLVYKFKSITDSTLVMKMDGYAFDNTYTIFVKIKR